MTPSDVLPLVTLVGALLFLTGLASAKRRLERRASRPKERD